MHYFKRLILLTIIISCSFSQTLTYRGKNLVDLIGQPIPLAFTNMVTENYNILPSQINPQRGSYMIISPDGLVGYLDDFVEFKNSQGFDVYVIALSEAGSSADDIKTTISNKLLEDPMLEYVLLLGDVDGFAEFPSFYYGPENDVTDQKYVHISGNDNIPDIFIGRLSIDSLSDLAVIMSKTIQYARNPLAYDQDWLDRGLIVAGNYANTYPIPITPKWTSYWLRDELLNHGYSEVDTVFYPPVQQGAPYIIPLIDNGVGIVNYRGWGDANGWHYPEFHVDDVNDLNNGWLTPVFMSYVCNSNDFANNVDPCLAEAVLRGGTPTVPKGGVAFIGPSDLHTSTKYNNVINAYMYDAMLNHGVVELGPAMQAGQSGLLKEFPAQNGSGEAQEFYAHVYNILGDPSLQVYLDTPDQFNFDIEELSSNDGLLDMHITNSNGLAVNQVVISIMNDGQLIRKGITDQDGRFLATLDVSNIYSLDIYANKGGYIQGHETAYLEAGNNDLSLGGLSIIGENGSARPTLSELIDFSLTLNNSSENATSAFSGHINFSDHVYPNSFDVNVPSISPNSTVDLTNIQFSCFGVDAGEGILGSLVDGEGNEVFNFVLTIELPVFDIGFQNNVSPGDSFTPSFLITNYSAGIFNDIDIQVSTISEGAVVNNTTTDIVANIGAFDTDVFSTDFNIILDEVAYGSEVTFLVEFQKSDQTFFAQEVPLYIEPISENYPVSPNNYGYWAYDDLDTGFEHAPVFNWIELDPNHGGTNGEHYQLNDDDHVDIELPFSFKYHGIQYEQITISSNGWTSFEPCDIDYFWNMSIPMYMGPKALMAPFSDDLETIDSNGDGDVDVFINVYTWYDEANGQFIIEWSRALNGYDEVTEETFEIVLHNQSSISTETGDGVIDFQYLEIDDVDVTKNYSTVGIEAPMKNYGLQYAFNNVYASGAAPLVNERIIRFTTSSPENYISPLEIEEQFSPEGFILSSAYPNPFNPITYLDITVPITERIKVSIVDILGREVRVIENNMMVPGHYRISWNGRGALGSSVSSGTYFVVMQYGQDTQIKKILFLK